MQSFWLKYKSGTDIRFTAVDTPAKAADISAETVTAIAKAFAVWLGRKRGRNNLTVAVGHDCRVSAHWIKDAVIKGLSYSGCNILDSGLCSTPSMFQMTKHAETKADGSIMITASHHPFDKNGLKFFTPDGGLEGEDITDILELAGKHSEIHGEAGDYRRADYMELYVRDLLAHFRKATGADRPLEGLHIVVDAGNGAGGFFASRVLEPLGANTTGSQFLEPDGYFPNHIPNPENADAMRAISECVVRESADLGIIFDTDVDRAAIVASDGREINRNRLIALIGSIVLAEYPGATIVTDSVTSDGLAKFIKERGGVHHRFKRGYKNVIDEAIRLTQSGQMSPLAIETSGHAALAENYYLDDGAYLVVKLLISMCLLKQDGKSLTSLIDGLEEPVETCEMRLGYADEVKDWKIAGAEALTRFEAEAAAHDGWRIAADSYEGVRVSTPEGFFLIRMSVHDPNLPVNFESNVPGGVAVMQREMLAILERCDAIELGKLKAEIHG